MNRILLAGVAALAAWSTPAKAEQVPAHLASLAAALYREAQSRLSDPAADLDHQKAAERALDVLRRSGIRYWARDPVKLPEGAVEIARKLQLDLQNADDVAFLERLLGLNEEELRKALRDREAAAGRSVDERTLNDLVAAVRALTAPESLAQSHRIKLQGGESLELRWTPQTGDLIIRAASDGSGSIPEYDAILAGKTDTSVDPQTGDLSVQTAPGDPTVRTLVATELEELRASIVGDWRAPDGTVIDISASDASAGDIDAPAVDYEAQIADLNAEIEKIKNAKVFVWENRDTGEIVTQQHFRRLDEPFQYRGEQHSSPDAAAKIEQLSTKIASLENLRKGAGLPPAERYDPVGFEENRSGAKARPLRISAVAPDGFEYVWDEASFDGRRITARRTFRDVRELNQPLPATIKSQLIASWSPPTWLEMEASIDPRTATVTLDGYQWGLHVHYQGGGMIGGDYKVMGIDTPYSWAVTFEKNDFLVAEGAAADLRP